MEREGTFRLETARLVLRDLNEEDWPLIHALSGETMVTRYQTWMRRKDEAECKAWLAELLARTNHRRPRESYNLGFRVKGAPDLIGWVGFGKPLDPSKGELGLGYALLPAFWNRGYMTEVVTAVVDYVFGSLEKQSIYATCAASNVASGRVLEKSHMVLVDRWPEEDPASRLVEEHLCYRIARDEWLRWRPQA